eukprot:m.1544327 g.1544327  ORF g.1544327 m.1544327 type:complete len:417 (+) comp25258_c0_seq3:4405-5655(+)
MTCYRLGRSDQRNSSRIAICRCLIASWLTVELSGGALRVDFAAAVAAVPGVASVVAAAVSVPAVAVVAPGFCAHAPPARALPWVLLPVGRRPARSVVAAPDVLAHADGPTATLAPTLVPRADEAGGCGTCAAAALPLADAWTAGPAEVATAPAPARGDDLLSRCAAMCSTAHRNSASPLGCGVAAVRPRLALSASASAPPARFVDCDGTCSRLLLPVRNAGSILTGFSACSTGCARAVQDSPAPPSTGSAVVLTAAVSVIGGTTAAAGAAATGARAVASPWARMRHKSTAATCLQRLVPPCATTGQVHVAPTTVPVPARCSISTETSYRTASPRVIRELLTLVLARRTAFSTFRCHTSSPTFDSRCSPPRNVVGFWTNSCIAARVTVTAACSTYCHLSSAPCAAGCGDAGSSVESL